MSSSNLTTVQKDVLNIVMPLVAATVTSFRLYCRARQGRLWIDDLWATFAMLSILTLLIVNWIYMEAYGEPRFLVYGTYHFLQIPRKISPGHEGSNVLHARRIISHSCLVLQDINSVNSCTTHSSRNPQEDPHAYYNGLCHFMGCTLCTGVVDL